jgi:murein DD-endopeptidase MepM/ murein hydrolase activator NlpD
METRLQEFMSEVFTSSELLIWNFADITENDNYKNIQNFMREQEARGNDPREAFHRQAFNNQVFSRTQSRYLIGRYLEDRIDILRGSHIASEGRTFHLAIDIFARTQEVVYVPCDGEIVVSAKEEGQHNYGNYLILRPNDSSLPYIFFGHLADEKATVGRQVKAGQQIGRLGSFKNLENGGWSVHLHLQLLTELPTRGQAPIGYTTKQDIDVNRQRFPDPMSIFTDWHVVR